MVKVTVSPSTLPSVMVDLPVNELVVSPVTLLPSCLKVNVRSIAPGGPAAGAFQLPLMSAAHALKANSANNAGSHFILQAPFNSRQYTLGQGACVFTRFSDLLIYGFATSLLILQAETVAKDGTHDARRDRTPHRLLTRLARRRCPAAFVALRRPLQIGRASCRERV